MGLGVAFDDERVWDVSGQEDEALRETVDPQFALTGNAYERVEAMVRAVQGNGTATEELGRTIIRHTIGTRAPDDRPPNHAAATGASSGSSWRSSPPEHSSATPSSNDSSPPSPCSSAGKH